MKIAESVVSKGGGHAAYIPGYRIGGKTGTAQKVVDGRYAQGKYICSFMGIAPTDDPQIVVLAIVDLSLIHIFWTSSIFKDNIWYYICRWST